MNYSKVSVAVLVALAMVRVRGPVGTSLAEKTVNPKDFTTTIDNPFLPLLPGTTYIYEGTKDGSPAQDQIEVTDQTKVIMGVTCRQVRDQAYVDGILAEDTLDWFAQDKNGNVWYFGED